MTIRDDDIRNESALPDDPAVQALYRQLPADQPPAALDEAILAAARRAAGSKPRAVPAWQRWRIPLAAAASILLSVMLLRHTVVTPGVGEPAALEQYGVSERSERAPAVPVDAIAETAPEAMTTAPRPPAAPMTEGNVADSAVADSAVATAADRAAPAKKSAAPLLPEERVRPSARETVALREEPARAAEEDAAPAVAAAPAPVAATASAPVADAAVADSVMARSKMAARDARAVAAADASATGGAGAAEARKETVAALAGKSVPAAAPPAAPAVAGPRQSATVARAGSWPFGLLPTLSPEVACARLTQDAGGSCSGRTEGGGLVLRLTGADRDWPERLQEALTDLGWLPDPAAGAGQYRRSLPAGDLLAWRSPAPGVLELRLRPAVSP